MSTRCAVLQWRKGSAPVAAACLELRALVSLLEVSRGMAGERGCSVVKWEERDGRGRGELSTKIRDGREVEGKGAPSETRRNLERKRGQFPSRFWFATARHSESHHTILYSWAELSRSWKAVCRRSSIAEQLGRFLRSKLRRRGDQQTEGAARGAWTLRTVALRFSKACAQSARSREDDLGA